MSKGNTLGTTEADARSEAARLMAYWHNLGYSQVRVSVEAYSERHRNEYICGWRIKSNLVKGRPIGPPLTPTSAARRA
jgi:hypothetical protein